MQEGNLNFLSDEYKQILNQSESIKKEFSQRPKALETLYGIVTDLYVDVQKCLGRDVSLPVFYYFLILWVIPQSE